MAFFGLTGLGYQDPFRAARVPEEERHEQLGKGENAQTVLPAIVPPSTYSSQIKYKEIMRRHQALRTPKQTQRLPLTATQRYGWWVSEDPEVKTEYVHPWIQVPRYPVINSPMTRFVDQMAVTNKQFRLF
ncbi:sperm microtubule inner protein 11 [Pelobates fuscus]|uniref:sperm microtubule inner protein 11 n=1 Tax=Pelobates fuscus TaxID=191477 RepID=UPI002FE493FE